MEKVESILPSSLWHQLTRIWIRNPTSIRTETAELKPRTFERRPDWHAFVSREVQTKLRRPGGRQTKKWKNGIRIGFDFIWYVCIFLGFQSFGAVFFFVVQKKGDQLPSLKEKKNKIKDFLWIAAIQLLPTILIQPTQELLKLPKATRLLCATVSIHKHATGKHLYGGNSS